MKKLTQRQVDKLFKEYSQNLYSSFISNAVAAYTSLFPEKCRSKDFDDSRYDMIRERLMFEFQILYGEAKGEKNVKKKCKKASHPLYISVSSAKRTLVG